MSSRSAALLDRLLLGRGGTHTRVPSMSKRIASTMNSAWSTGKNGESDMIPFPVLYAVERGRCGVARRVATREKIRANVVDKGKRSSQARRRENRKIVPHFAASFRDPVSLQLIAIRAAFHAQVRAISQNQENRQKNQRRCDARHVRLHRCSCYLHPSPPSTLTPAADST